MRRSVGALLLAGCLTWLAACGDDSGADDAADGRSDGSTEEAPAFALVRGQDTLLIEQFTLSGSRVSGVMRDPIGSVVEYETTYSTGGGERTMRVTVRPPDAAATPIVSTFTLRGDSAWLESTRGDSTVRNGDAVPANALPYLAPSMGMMALVAQSARAMVGDSGQVPLLAVSVSQNAVLVQPLVYWRADTAWVVGDQLNQFRLVFSDGALVSAENGPQQMRAVRLPAGAALVPGGGASRQPSVQQPSVQPPSAQPPSSRQPPAQQPGARPGTTPAD